ncbi:hypothetical protein HWQ46_26355 [Shewanella sp. D64]|uniref:hypothetical protein n=1 Tax=unclassified Shewanella TaxID=196818 RepID=UPI0022BA6D69|nr:MULTISPECIES: hypothetical protein [unclassified Shewanella]MEC4729039.1 hypothetical protein [Shewanella sp. D64]MEC4737902.1 hypothetical protein [Shewanella sp. E94]WBJ93845.1 hypothetical protein HWQ47_18190 [Shewanella sp. MTB7]
MRRFSLLLAIVCLVFTNNTDAKRNWPSQALTSWSLSLNNGVAYISSSQFPEHCRYSRGQINMSGTEFDKAQYAYALSAKARGKSLRYVIDNTQTTCIITGLSEVNE